MTAREDAGHPVVVAAVLAAGILAAAQIGKVPPLLPAMYLPIPPRGAPCRHDSGTALSRSLRGAERVSLTRSLLLLQLPLG